MRSVLPSDAPRFRRLSFLVGITVILWGMLASILPLGGEASAASDVSAQVVQRNLTRSWTFLQELAPSRETTFPQDANLDAPVSEGDPRVVDPPTRADWTFSANVRAHSETTGQHLWPDVAVSASGLTGAAWMDDHLSGGYHIFYASSTDGGQTWSAPEQVDDRIPGAYSKFVDLEFTPAGIPVAVWEDDRSGGINVYLSRRDPANGGTPWTTNVRINTAGSPPDGSYYMNPSVAILDAQRFFVAWTDWRESIFNQVYIRSSANGGITWGPEVRISDEIGYQPLAGNPCLIVDPASGSTPGTEVLYCVMDDWRGYAPGGRFPDVYFSRSTNGGAAWSNGVRVNDIVDYFQQGSSHALLLLPDGTLTCGWLSGDFSLYTYRVCVSEDHGSTWRASVRVDDPALGGCGTVSSIAASGNYVFAGMDVYQGSWNSTLRVSSNGGRTWPDAQQRMDDDVSGAASGNTVVAAISPGEMVGVWQDTRPGTGAWKIYTTHGMRDLTGIDQSDPPNSLSVAEGGSVLHSIPNPSQMGSPVELRLTPTSPDAASAVISTGGSSGSSPGSIVILDPSGRRIRSLALRSSSVIWDGKDDRGDNTPAGLYFARVRGVAGWGASVLRIR